MARLIRFGTCDVTQIQERHLRNDHDLEVRQILYIYDCKDEDQSSQHGEYVEHGLSLSFSSNFFVENTHEWQTLGLLWRRVLYPNFDCGEDWDNNHEDQMDDSAHHIELIVWSIPKVGIRILIPCMNLKYIHDNNIDVSLQENFGEHIVEISFIVWLVNFKTELPCPLLPMIEHTDLVN